MNDDSRIYVEAGQPATLNDGAGKLTDCATLQEAPLGLACAALSTEDTGAVKVIGGPVYTAHQIDRFHTGRSRRDIQRFVHGMVSSRRQCRPVQDDGWPWRTEKGGRSRPSSPVGKSIPPPCPLYQRNLPFLVGNHATEIRFPRSYEDPEKPYVLHSCIPSVR